MTQARDNEVFFKKKPERMKIEFTFCAGELALSLVGSDDDCGFLDTQKFLGWKQYMVAGCDPTSYL